MALTWAEPGTSPTQSFALFTSTTGTVSSDGSTLIAGERSIKGDSGAAAGAQAYVQKNTILTAAGGRISFRFKVSALPNADCAILDTLDASNNFNFRIFLKTTGKLRIVGNTTVLGSDSSVTITTNTEYQVVLAWTITNTTTNQARVFVNGTQECSASNATLPSASLDRMRVGWTQTNVGGSNRIINVGQIVVDDDSSLTDTGDIRATAKMSSTLAARASFWNDLGTGACNERPPSSLNGQQFNNNLNNGLVVFNVEAASAGDRDITGATTAGFYGWCLARRQSGTYTGTDQLVTINADGTVSTVIALTTTATYFQEPPRTTANYPTQVGGNRNVANGPDFFLDECGTVVVYLEPAPGAGQPTMARWGGTPFMSPGVRQTGRGW